MVIETRVFAANSDAEYQINTRIGVTRFIEPLWKSTLAAQWDAKFLLADPVPQPTRTQRRGTIRAIAIKRTATALPTEGSLAIKCTMPEMLPKPTYNIRHLLLCALKVQKAWIGKAPLRIFYAPPLAA